VAKSFKLEIIEQERDMDHIHISRLWLSEGIQSRR
jgi:hypothetical protein